MTGRSLSTDDDEFLSEVFDIALRQRATGEDSGELDALVARRPYLRSEVLLAIDLAREVAVVEAPELEAPRAPLVVNGFTILEEVGRGGVGVVYRARQDRVGRIVALKFLAPSLTASSRSRERFLAEARALGRIRHPNVVTVHEVLAEDHLCGYAMEWVDGTTLAKAITGPGPRLDVATIARLGGDIARALSVVHAAGMIHRDVKPGNILLRRDGTPLLADFSVVRDADQSQHTATGDFVGTAAYAAPEQLRGRHSEVGPWTDVYALGVTLYSALTSEAPFGTSSTAEMLRRIEDGLAKPVSKVNPRVPRDLETIVAKAMDPEPARRYQTAEEMADDLDRFLRYEPVRARRVGIGSRVLRMARRNRAAFLAASVASILVLGVAIAVGVSWKRRVELPGRFREQLRLARSHLLDPSLNHRVFIAVNIRGSEAVDLRLPPVAVIDRALDGYRAAMSLVPDDRTATQEHAVVSIARAMLGGERKLPPSADSLRDACPATYRIAAEWIEAELPQDVDFTTLDGMTPVDRRHLGLLAFLCTRVALCVRAWAPLDGDPDLDDPLIAGALGEAWLVMDRAALAVPRLARARQAFPECGFLTLDLADALVRTGDLARAEAMLAVAKRLPNHESEPTRVEADLCAARGERERARELYYGLGPMGPTGTFHLARFLARQGEKEAAFDVLAPICVPMPEVRRYRALLLEIVDPAWRRLTLEQQAEVVAEASVGRHGTAPLYAIGAILRDRGGVAGGPPDHEPSRRAGLDGLIVTPEVMRILGAPSWRSRPRSSRAVAQFALRTDAALRGTMLGSIITAAIARTREHDRREAMDWRGRWEVRDPEKYRAQGARADVMLSNVAAAGDVDRDGRGDVLVGDPSAADGRGSARLASGFDGRVIHDFPSEGEKNLGQSLAAAGDVDRDGTADVLVGARGKVLVCSGRSGGVIRTIGGREEGDGFGEALAFAGDVDADGCPDVIVGAPARAYVQLFSGRSGALLRTFEGPRSSEFGFAVDGGLDADGDAVPDVLIGARSENVPPFRQNGRVSLFSGGTGALLWSEPGGTSWIGLGSSVAMLPDLNGDGYADWAAGAPEERCDWIGMGPGHVRIYAGPRGDLLKVIGGANTRRGGFGHGVARAPDADGDGIQDLLVGADLSYAGDGASYVDLLSPGEEFALIRRIPAMRVSWRPSVLGGDDGSSASLLIGALESPGFSRIPVGPGPR